MVGTKMPGASFLQRVCEMRITDEMREYVRINHGETLDTFIRELIASDIADDDMSLEELAELAGYRLAPLDYDLPLSRKPLMVTKS